MTRMITILAILLMAAAPLLAQEVKQSSPDQPASPFVPQPCGPDDFGYVCADECLFQFIDISSTGTFILEGDDASSGAVPLDMPFSFYGSLYTELALSSNGYLTTDVAESGGDLTNDCPLPDDPSTGGGARIYVLHDDLDLEAGFGSAYVQYFEVCPRPGRGGDEPCTVFMWNDVAHYPGGPDAVTWDQEAILYHATGDIAIQILAGNPETGSSSTTGMMNEDYTIGLNVVCNEEGSVPDDACWFILNPDVVATENVSFSTIKGMFR